jgi:hypothetical protein
VSSIHRRSFAPIALCAAFLLLSGCISGSSTAVEADRATGINPATTQPSFWYDQPDTGSVSSGDFDRLWDVCAGVARDHFFEIDVRDYRAGLLVTEPMVSGQWFEPWRTETRTFDDVMESSMASIRRTIRFEFTRNADGAWSVAPKVLVERQEIAEKRITSVILYRNLFMPPSRARYRASGTAESDQGIYLPERYWYPVKRDAAFEAALVREIEQRLSHK